MTRAAAIMLGALAVSLVTALTCVDILIRATDLNFRPLRNGADTEAILESSEFHTRVRTNALGFQALHEWVAHHVRQLIDSLARGGRVHLFLPRLGFVHRALSRDQLAGEFSETRTLDVEPVGLGPEDSRLALIR